MVLKNPKVTKGIVFAGCSFTWGQGLYYYSNLPTLKEPPPNQYFKEFVTDAHKNYMSTLRFPRLVANHFNTFEVVTNINGGSEDNSILFLKGIFGLKNIPDDWSTNKLSFDEIEFIVLQTSQIFRNYFEFTYNGEIHQFFPWDRNESNIFYKWLNDNNLNFDEWLEEHLKNVYYKLKTELDFYESRGIKVLILSWENDYLEKFGNDKWLIDRFIPIVYNNKDYKTIRNLMNENENCIIHSDYENFIVPPQDHHPSKLCHEIIAQNIIDKIEKIKNYVPKII